MDVAVHTSLGPSRLVIDEAVTPRAVLWLGHSAGGGIDSRALAALAAGLPARGVTVARYEQPWRTAGRRIAVRPAQLDIAWREAAGTVADLAGTLPLFVGGHSAGARVACRTADDLGARGVICLSFPLHPPGKPETSRLPELELPTAPVLVLQGDRDEFGSATTVRSAVERRGNIRIIELSGADHGLKTLRSSGLSAAGLSATLVDAVDEFITATL